jgi:hypothetical protein
MTFERNNVMDELIAKPPALSETRTPDPHFSGIAHWLAMFPGGFAINSDGFRKKPIEAEKQDMSCFSASVIA